MEDQQQLAACPFCGFDPQLVRSKLLPSLMRYECSDCGAHSEAMAIAETDAAKHWNRRASPSSSVLERARDALRNLISGYVNTLENGRDRIIFLGGQCDSVETMERSDPNLRAARSALAEIDRALGGGNGK